MTMGNYFYDCLIGEYHIFDYMGDSPFEMVITTKAQSRTIFEGFMRELPCRIGELRKIVPQEIALDYSYESIQRLDIWIEDLCFKHKYGLFEQQNIAKNISDYYKYYNNKKDEGDLSFFSGTPTDFSIRMALPKILRSIITDSTIYFVECIRRLYADDVIWVEGRYKENQAGHPQIASILLDDNISDFLIKKNKWPITYSIALRFSSLINYYNKNDSPPRVIGDMDNIYKIILKLERWDLPVPEEYRYPKF